MCRYCCHIYEKYIFIVHLQVFRAEIVVRWMKLSLIETKGC